MTFEYKIIETRMFDRRVHTLEAEMNELGGAGWELATACGLHNQTFVFIRTLAPQKKTRSKAETAAD
jgi:hypothetical protein